MSTTTQPMKSHKNEPRNKRWKWMAGATAATAGITAPQAYGITINLVNNYISTFGGNHLNADLTGDGHPDLTIANAYTRRANTYLAYVTLNGVSAFGKHSNSGGGPWLNVFDRVRLGSRRASYTRVLSYGYTIARYGTYPLLMGSIPIFFKDLHINGGAPTEGFLEVTVSPYGIQLDSFTYNDPSFHAANGTAVPDQGSSRAVPDQGSSLALLAIGAAGILALRRSRSAQADFQCRKLLKL